MKPSDSALDFPAVSGNYLFPRSAPLHDPWDVFVDGAVLACHREQVDPCLPTLIHFHGNGEVVRDYLPEPLGCFVQCGVNVVLAEYRGYGGSTGSPAMVAMLDDVEAIFDSLEVPAERTIAFGRSIGSLYAVELAKRRPQLGALALESAIAEPFERFLAYADLDDTFITTETLRSETKKHFDQRGKLEAYVGPLLILHAEDDQLVDVSHGKRLHQWGGGANKRLALLPRGGHNGLMSANLEAYFEQVRELVGVVS